MKNENYDFPCVSERQEKTKIKRIVITASLCSDADQQAKELMNTRCQRSFHYIIGDDGKLVYGLPEDKRAWGVRNKLVDSESICICVCTDGSKGCIVSDAAVNTIVQLCADICKRYKFEPYCNGTDSGSVFLYYAGGCLRGNISAIIALIIKEMGETKKRKGGTKK